MLQNEQVVQNTICVVGDFLHEGLSAKVATLGYTLTKLSIKTTAKHWQRAISQLRAARESGARTAFVVYLPTPTLLRIAEVSLTSHKETVALLVDELRAVPSVVFVHEDNLLGQLEPPPWEYEGLMVQELENIPPKWQELFQDDPELLAEYEAQLKERARREHRMPTREEWFAENSAIIAQASELLDEMITQGVEVVPFRSRHEVTTRIMETLDDLDAGVFLRLYVPSGRYQGEQFQDFLDLFARYFREVEGREFAIDTKSTRRGTTYIFRGRAEVSGVSDVQSGIRRFDEFMSVAQLDPKRAEAMLAANGLSSRDAAELVAKYSRSYKRLALDMRHEWDRKRLALSQALETDVLDLGDVPALPSVPTQPSALLSVVGNSGSVTISLTGNQLAIGANARQVVEQLVNGDVTYSEEDRELLRRIEALANRVEALSLRSDLDRLKDDAIPADERKTAAQRLRAFVIRNARAAGQKAVDIGTQVLIKYLEGLVSGTSS